MTPQEALKQLRDAVKGQNKGSDDAGCYAVVYDFRRASDETQPSLYKNLPWRGALK